MIEFILNNQTISTDLPPGMTVLDFVRYHQNLKGTKIGCREGDCGACTILVGELISDEVSYRSMTSCLMPLANAASKHIVSIEGINPEDGSLTPVQQAMLDESGTQCGFCTVGFVMSLTGFCLDKTEKTAELAISSIDGNICRCTGYKSIERAAVSISRQLSEPGAIRDFLPQNRGDCEKKETSIKNSIPNQGEVAMLGEQGGSLRRAIDQLIVPGYFSEVAARLKSFGISSAQPSNGGTQNVFVGGGTDVYVQRPEEIAETKASNLFYDESLRGIRDLGGQIEIGASVTVTDLLESPIMQGIFPSLYNHLKLISSTPIRNMATLAGNFVNASPIGDMTVWFLALDAEIDIEAGAQASRLQSGESGEPNARTIRLRDFYQGYKQLSKSDDEYITTIRFRKPAGDFRFNFEKVSKRTYLDIATANTAISMTVEALPGAGWTPPALADAGKTASPGSASSEADEGRNRYSGPAVEYTVTEAHVSVGGVAPVPLYLKRTSEYLKGKPVTAETIAHANEIMQSEISPISDVRGTAEYKRLLLRQLFKAHFYLLFGESGIQ